MIKDINSDLIRGHINTIILKALFAGDRYGYDICREIEEKSSGQYKLKQPTLYSCLKRLESSGYITSYWGGTNVSGGRRKYYTLTALGRDLFVESQTEWEYSRTVIDKLISDRPYNIEGLKSVSQPTNIDCESVDDESSFLEIEESYSDEKPASDSIVCDEKQKDLTEEIKVGTTEEIKEAPTTDFGLTDAENEAAFADDSSDSTIEIEMLHNLDYDSASSYSDSIQKKFIEIKDYEPHNYYGTKRYLNYNYDQKDDYINDNQSLVNTDDSDRDLVEIENSKESVGEKTYFDEAENDVLEGVAYDDAQSFVNNKNESIEPDYDDEEAIVRKIIDEYKRPSYSAPAGNLLFAQEGINSDEFISKEYKSIIGKIFGTNDRHSVLLDAKKAEIESSKSAIDTKGENLRIRPATRISGADTPLTVRSHSKSVSAEYNSSFYYYSNKMRCVHYGIMFCFMLLEIAIVFLSIKFGAKLTQSNEWVFYLLAVLTAVALPSVAVGLYSKDPEHKKRYIFNFKGSLFFRCILAVNLIIFVCLANFFFARNSLTNPAEYIVSLVLPCVLILNIPLASVMFHLIYRTKKFNA